MDTSASMNIHDLAMHQIIQQHHSKNKKEKTLPPGSVMEPQLNKGHRDLKPTGSEVLFNATVRQPDIQAQSIRVERQQDVQAAKETVSQSDSGPSNVKADGRESGKLIDIMT